MLQSCFSVMPDRVKSSANQISGCSSSLENSSAQIDEVKDGLSSGLMAMGPVVAALSARTRAHAAKTAALGTGLTAITQQYVTHQNNIVANIQQGGSFTL